MNRPQCIAPMLLALVLRGVGPRLADPAMDTIHLYPFAAYEDIRLKTP